MYDIEPIIWRKGFLRKENLGPQEEGPWNSRTSIMKMTPPALPLRLLAIYSHTYDKVCPASIQPCNET